MLRGLLGVEPSRGGWRVLVGRVVSVDRTSPQVKGDRAKVKGR
jgi:hypothetical protein